MGADSSQASQPRLQGGYFPQLPPEMNSHVQSFLDIPNATRIRRLNREASDFRPTKQNLLNSSYDTLYSYVYSHPEDMKALEVMFWRTLEEKGTLFRPNVKLPKSKKPMVYGEVLHPKIAELVRQNLDTVLDTLYQHGTLDTVNVIWPLKDIGINYGAYAHKRMIEDALTMTYEQLYDHPIIPFSESRAFGEIVMDRFGRKGHKLLSHWDYLNPTYE